jgi:hypothetical protein
MSTPQFSIRSTMFAVLLAAANCALLPLAFVHYAPMGLVFGVFGIFPMANILAIACYRNLSRRTAGRPFFLGFALTGSLVRPDGKIRLSYYGDVYVEGLTPSEAQAKILVHLHHYLSDDAPGPVEPVVDANGQRLASRNPSAYETNLVSVWVVTKNSSAGIVDGIVQAIRRFLYASARVIGLTFA